MADSAPRLKAVEWAVQARGTMAWLRRKQPELYAAKKTDEAEVKELWQWFNLIDADGGGTIDIDELAEPLTGLGLCYSRGQAADMVAQISTQASDEITFEDFCVLLQNKPEKLPPGRRRRLLAVQEKQRKAAEARQAMRQRSLKAPPKSSRARGGDNPAATMKKLLGNLRSSADADASGLGLATMLASQRRALLLKGLFSFSQNADAVSPRSHNARRTVDALQALKQTQEEEPESPTLVEERRARLVARTSKLQRHEIRRQSAKLDASIEAELVDEPITVVGDDWGWGSQGSSLLTPQSHKPERASRYAAAGSSKLHIQSFPHSRVDLLSSPTGWSMPESLAGGSALPSPAGTASPKRPQTSAGGPSRPKLAATARPFPRRGSAPLRRRQPGTASAPAFRPRTVETWVTPRDPKRRQVPVLVRVPLTSTPNPRPGSSSGRRSTTRVGRASPVRPMTSSSRMPRSPTHTQPEFKPVATAAPLSATVQRARQEELSKSLAVYKLSAEDEAQQEPLVRSLHLPEFSDKVPPEASMWVKASVGSGDGKWGFALK